MGAIPVFNGNPRQSWQFLVRIDGFDVAYFQKATIPEREVEVDEFNPAGSIRPTKFAGRSKIGDCTLEKGMFADDGDFAAWDWLTSASDTLTGDLGDPGTYRKDIEIVHIDRVGSPIQTWLLKETFCSKIEWSDNEGESSDHSVETLTLTVGDMEVN